MSEQQISSETHAEQVSALLERFNALPSELAQQQWLEMANGLFQSVLEPAVNSVRTTLTDSLFPSGMAEILKQEPPITMAVVLSKLSLQQACDVLRFNRNGSQVGYSQPNGGNQKGTDKTIVGGSR